VCYADTIGRYARWQERWRDPMLTALLVLLALEVFVGIPLARAHFSEAPLFVVAWFLLIMARSLSNLEAVIGPLFPATRLAGIVALEIRARRSSGTGT